VNDNATNHIADLSIGYKLLTATNNVHFIMSTNRLASLWRSATIVIESGATNRLLTFNANWKWLGTTNNPPTLLASNKVAVLNISSYGTSETNVIASFANQP
jgi:hypothetical protein